MDRAGPSAPRTGDYVDWDAWLTRFPTPHPGRPVPTPDPKVTFGASPVKCRAAWAADGRHPGRHQIMPALFWEPDLCGVSDGASPPLPLCVARIQRLPFSRETCNGRECQNISVGGRPGTGAGGASRRRPRRGALEDGREAPGPDSLALKGAITRAYMETLGLRTLSIVGDSPVREAPFAIGRDFRPCLHRSVQALIVSEQDHRPRPVAAASAT
jgi:hypothetical protein